MEVEQPKLVRDDRVMTAYHEAGHAIMAMACNYPVSKISIESDENGKGHTIWGTTDKLGSPIHSRNSVVIYIGGMVADGVHWHEWGKGSDDDVPLGWFDDRDTIEKHLSLLQEQELIEAYMRFARLYLCRPDVWPIVDKVAQALLMVGSIDGVDVLEGIKSHCPLLTGTDWAVLEAIKRQFSPN